MTWEELLEDFPTKLTSFDYPRFARRQAERYGAAGIPNKLGSGDYATVYGDAKDPHGVVKVGQAIMNKTSLDTPPDLSADGYLAFLKSILKSDNPYFPQLGEVQLFRNRQTGVVSYKVKMEMLHPISDLSIEELTATYHRIVGAESPSGYTTKTGLAAMIEKAMNNPKYAAKMEDSNFREACSILHKLIKRGYFNDMSSNNIMCRRTPYGAQIVFTDPFTSLHPS